MEPQINQYLLNTGGKMTFKPAHKDTDTPPGQIVNPLPHMPSEEIPRSKTIGGIVDRVMRSEAQPIKKKLTFDEWLTLDSKKTMLSLAYEESYEDIILLMEEAWKAAQENV